MIRAAFCLAFGGALLLFALWPNIRPVLLVNAHIVTLDAQSSIADALLFKGGRILEAGASLDEEYVAK